MSDDFEDLLKRWFRDRAGSDPAALEALAGNAAALPPRRRSGPGRLVPIAASIVVLIGLLVVVAPPFGGVGGESTSTLPDATRGSTFPGGPEGFANDPRLSRCFGVPADMEFVFEMIHARDYRSYFPHIGLAPELDVDESAFVVVFRDGWVGPPTSGVPGAGRPTPIPGHRFVCVLADGGEPNLYADVDITGLTLDVVPSESSPRPISTDEPSATPTPPPAPAWVSDLAGQLDCDGPVANIGGEVPDADYASGLADTPDAALTSFLGPSNAYASLPAAGFTQIHLDEHWASYTHVFGGRARTIIVLSDVTEFGTGWLVVGLRACDASEFDPDVPLTFPVTIWTDAAGNRASTETIRSTPGPGHCGWDSAIWLHVGANLYFRDPAGVMALFTETVFEPKVHLPDGAVDSGFRTGEWSLWLDPGGDAYLLSPGTVERWPRSVDPNIGCA